MQTVVERFKRYIAIDTQSDASSESTPSTASQWELARLLEAELKELGLVDISLDEHCYLFATLPSNSESPLPTVGFLAHMDTAPDFAGGCTNPHEIKYEGGIIKLGEGRELTPEKFPILEKLKGETLITTDGSTLLAGDDKAGIAEIICALEYLQEHPEIKHGPIRVGFTPDEEIGRGPHKFSVKRFGADFAYTVDGGRLGEFSYESFNAASASIKITGESIHPGSAKNKLLNASLVGMELNALLPAAERPEHTENYEGFYLLTHMEGGVAEASMEYIIRDHDKAEFAARKRYLENCVAFLRQKYGDIIELEITDSYYNMAEVISQHREVVDLALRAFAESQVEPLLEPIRGGTDGSQLSYMGLPTPNMFTGDLNPHGPYEFVVVSWMQKAVQVIINIAKLIAA